MNGKQKLIKISLFVEIKEPWWNLLQLVNL